MTEATAATQPLISVVIATRNRAEMLLDSLHSVLSQTYRRLEVIVVDDGSEDDTRTVVEGIADPRVRYVGQEHSGISAARNRGTDHATGEWIAVHDDDDIMLPFRLAEQLKHVQDDVDFIYGAFINFDDDTGELQLHHGRNYGYGPALMSGFAPGHSTWLVRTDLMRTFRYDEGIESAVDNNLVFRMLRSGVRLVHSGVICLLRRVHSGRITNTGGAGQKYVAGMNLAFISQGVPPKGKDTLTKAARRDWGPVDKTAWQTRYLPYMPDHLVKRSGHVSLVEPVSGTAGQKSGVPEISLHVERVEGMDWRTFMAACGTGVDVSSVRARLAESPEVERAIAPTEISSQLDVADLRHDALARLLELAPANATAEYLAIVSAAPEVWTSERRGLAVALCHFTEDGQKALVGLIPVRSWRAAQTLAASAFPVSAEVRILSGKPQSAIVSELSAGA
ncbi:glycosyltransferase family 2 protein [Brachybacterium sp. DNPG3]